MGKRVKVVGVALTNPETGETVRGELHLWQPSPGGAWVRVFQASKKALILQHPELHGQAHKVLSYLEAVVGWGNLLPQPKEVAEALGLVLRVVFRAYSELIQAGFIIKKEKAYYLSPLVAWKGNEEQLQQAWKMLPAPPSLLVDTRATYSTAKSEHGK